MAKKQMRFVAHSGAAKITLRCEHEDQQYVVIVPDTWLWSPTGPVNIFKGLSQYLWKDLADDPDKQKDFDDNFLSLNILTVEILDGVTCLLAGPED